MIGLHQFLYLRFFNGKKNFPSKCPNNNLNIQGRVNAETTKNVKSWPACSEICSQREDCNYWISAKKISTGTIELVKYRYNWTCYSVVQGRSRNTPMIASPCLIMGPQMRMVTLFLEPETVKVDRSAHSTLYRVSHNWVLTLFCLFYLLPMLIQWFILSLFNSPGDDDSKTHLTFIPT